MSLALRLSDFHYDLPAGRIAQEPATPRDQSRLLVWWSAGEKIEHRRFAEIDRYLREGDVLVVNATRVFPARLRARKATGGKAEILLLAPEPAGQERRWRALLRGNLKAGDVVLPGGRPARIRERSGEGEWIVEIPGEEARAYIEAHGEMPLPPYIKRKGDAPRDHERYQTVYAKADGAVAAPTAGFHFTDELLERLADKGVRKVEIVLHVGWGTFRPVRDECVENHRMLPERYEVSAEAAHELERARGTGGRIVAVGTTVVRTLETLAQDDGSIRAGSGESDLFITPGYRFKAIDALITNFHLSDSTPLLLANAFAWHKSQIAGNDQAAFPFTLKKAYETAVAESYRFYSYGDAMLIL